MISEVTQADKIAASEFYGKTGSGRLRWNPEEIADDDGVALAFARHAAPLREALRAIMELDGEINEANYNHDDVSALNLSFVRAFNIARKALGDES